MQTTEQNLTEALEVLGITHARDDYTDADQKHTWTTTGGVVIGRYDAHEGWTKLKELTDGVERERDKADCCADCRTMAPVPK